MQRRLELACALVHDPALMFLDEPTAGIDPILRVKVWKELHRLRADGRTMLVTTQYVNEAEACDMVALISGGRLIALADPENLRREAMGGDIVEIQTTNAFDPAGLSDLPVIRTIERQGQNAMRIRVDDAATAMPEVVEAITRRGGEVASASESRPSFDEVFAILVERDRLARGAARGEAA
jgi:ABC-2 type transport system ATP-binding protein